MMKLPVLNQNGEKVEELAWPEIFDVSVSSVVITLYHNFLRAAKRQPIANTKDRGEVSGGGKKPWKQKGTGNARAGSIRSPLWIGGGVTFGPRLERNFYQRQNSKVRRKAREMLLLDLTKDKKVVIVDKLEIENKTRRAVEVLNNLKVSGKIAVILKKGNLAFRNIAGVKVFTPARLDFIYLLAAEAVVISRQAFLELIQEKDKNEKDK